MNDLPNNDQPKNSLAPKNPYAKEDNVLKPGILTTPLSTHGFPTWTVYTLAVLGLLYILNPTLGVFEFLPDNLPFIGNLDEGAAFLLVWAGLVEYFEGKKYRKSE